MRTAREHPRGFAALAFVLVLLFTMSLALLWTGRSLLFEHRAAANQQRQAAAFAAAESGLEWARSRLNDARAIDTRCLPLPGTPAGATFRDRYAAPWVAVPATPTTAAPRGATSGYAPPPGLRVQCRIGPTQVVCDCAAAPPDRGEGPGFAVELAAIEGEERALWLVARGCSGGASDCDPGAVAQTEAQAAVRVKLRPHGDGAIEAETLRHGPLAVVPGSWRDGRCTAHSLHEPCGFEP